MLLILMYHQIADPMDTQSLSAFNQHLIYLVENFKIVLPGDPVPAKQLSICLTFDDAYFDFYHHIYPLLRAYNIKAMLGIPTAFIQERRDVDKSTRLGIAYPEGLETLNHPKQPLCCWDEIIDMVQSGYVKPASHTHSHCNFLDKSTLLEKEIVGSKTLLEAKLKIPVDSFIYPYGNMTHKAHRIVKQHYEYGLRIGSAVNRNWQSHNKLYYRIDADHLWKDNKPFDMPMIKRFQRKFWLNKLRGR